MPAGYDAEVAELFRDLRSASSLSESDLAARLSTRVEVVQALEQGALYALPPWAETCRVVNGYGTMLNLDVRPLLRRIYAQLEAGIVELGPKPIPEVPTMAPPESHDFAPGSNGLGGSGFEPGKFEPKYDVSGFEQKPFDSGKTSIEAPDWPENPFAKPKAAEPQAPQQQKQQPQWPQAQSPQPAQQNPFAAGQGAPFQMNRPPAAPPAQRKPAQQPPRPNGPAQPQPQKPQAPWAAGPVQQRPPASQQPTGQRQAQPQPQRPQPRPAQAQAQSALQRPQPHPKPVSQADLQAAWQQPAAQTEPQRRQPPAPQPAAARDEETPRRKRALLKWGLVLLLLAIMAGGGYFVLGHLKGQAGLQSSPPATLDPDDPRSRKADKLQGPS